MSARMETNTAMIQHGQGQAWQDFEQMCDLLNQGLILLNQDMTVAFWNLWMEKHSRLERNKVIDRHISDIFPDLEKKGFFWKARNVFTLGNFAFFPQQMHRYMFPMRSERYLDDGYEHMQQSVSLAPVRDAYGQIVQVLVSIVDDTNAAMYRDRLEKTLSTLEESNRTDHLTQVANRRFFMQCLDEELALWERNQLEFCLIILDIDHFKPINDTYGHQCGDQVLVNLATLLQSTLRPYDKIGRYGGEEFCILLPQTDCQSGLQVAERMRSVIAEYAFPCGRNAISLTVTISLGVTSAQTSATADSLLQKADQALYAAKNAGRNRVECRL